MSTLRLCAASELPVDGEAKELTLGERTICVANVDGHYAAMDNVCAHRGGPLGQGVVLDGKVVCPWHGWMYDPKTGIPDVDSSLRVAVYDISISGDDVMITI